MANKKSRRGPRLIPVELPKAGKVKIYANVKVADAVEEVTENMTLYKGVKLAMVIEAAYEQGRRDGRREVFDEFEKVKKKPELKHTNPGRPRKNP